MDRIQVQVLIGETRRVFFTTEPKSYTHLMQTIEREIPKIKFMAYGVMYENDEGDYVVLQDDEFCLKVAMLSCKKIPGTEVTRLKIKIFEGSSPSVKKAEAEKRTLKRSHSEICEEDQDSRKPSQTSLSFPRSLLYSYTKTADSTDNEKCDDNDTEKCENPFKDKEKTPLERYIVITEEKVQRKLEALEELRAQEKSVTERIERVKSSPADGNMCRNCHLRLGHTARTCEFGKCPSVFKCGEEKFHAGELNVKDIRSQAKKQEMELNKLREELENKKRAIDTMKDTVSIRIENDLLELNKEHYLINGQHKNWSLLRKHVYIVEQYCKQNMGGRIPGKHRIKDILSKALNANAKNTCTDDTGSFEFIPDTSNYPIRPKQSQKYSVKSKLQNHGIVFPSSSQSSTPTSTKGMYESNFSFSKQEQNDFRLALKLQQNEMEWHCESTSCDLEPTSVESYAVSPKAASPPAEPKNPAIEQDLELEADAAAALLALKRR